MAVIQMDPGLLLEGLTWGQRRFDLTFPGADNGQASTRLLAPPKWTMSFKSADAMSLDQASAWEALLLRLRGRVNVLEAWDVGRPAPLGTLRGAPELSALAAAGSTSLSIRTYGNVLAPGMYTVPVGTTIRTLRPSTATYISGGALQTAAANVPRYEDGQLLVEGEGTNLLSYSSQFDNAAWVKAAATVVANAAAAPDGTMTADALIADTTSAHHRLYRSIAAANNTQHCFSIFAKAYGVSRIQVSCGGTGLTGAGGSGADRLAVFNLTTGQVEGNHYGIQFEALLNGWYRLAILLNTDSDGGGIAPYVAPVASAATGTSTGDGSSGVLIWGADCKVGALSSHVPTTTSAATRYADAISVADPLATLRQGDWIQLGQGHGTSQLVKVVQGGQADSTGLLQVEVEPPLRSAMPAGTPVTWDRPKAYFRSTQSETKWDYSTVVQGGFTFDALEDWTT